MNFAVTATQRPIYPSSKPKRVDWDKLEAQVKKEVCLLPAKMFQSFVFQCFSFF